MRLAPTGPTRETNLNVSCQPNVNLNVFEVACLCVVQYFNNDTFYMQQPEYEGVWRNFQPLELLIIP